MACSSLHRLSEIDDTTDLWKVKVRISRKWNVVDFETGKQILRVEMVLLDENDHQVQATIPKRLITKYSAVIREGGVYFLQNLSVSPAKGVYRPVQHRYKVFFKWDTNVKPVSDIRLTFPKFKFDFVEYNNIKFRHGDNTYLTDVYGKLESVSNVMNVERGTLREIFLKDKSGTTLKVTLWGQANQQLPDDVVTASAGCPILVVTSSTVKLFDGNYSLSSTTATKIYVNLDIPEVADLKETNSNEETTVKLIAPSSTAITLEERMVSNRKTLVEIVQAVPNAAIGAKFTCKGVISEVIYDYEPFYFSCNNKECRKKVVHRGSKHWCDNCKNFVDYPVAKYKIHVEIRDRTQSVSISIFDREVERLLKLPVTEMIDLNTMDNGSESVKDILKKLVGLEFVFEIKISEFNIRNEDGDASFTASKVWVVNEEIEARHFTESIEGDRKMKRVVEDSTTYASSSESNNDSLHVTTYASSNQSNNASLQERKKQKMVDNKKIELASGGVTSYVSDRTKEKEICPSPIELNSEDMDDAPVSSIIAKGKRGRRKLLSE